MIQTIANGFHSFLLPGFIIFQKEIRLLGRKIYTLPSTSILKKEFKSCIDLGKNALYRQFTAVKTLTESDRKQIIKL